MTAKFTDEPCYACGAARAVVNGAWLRQQRLRSGLTLREVARLLGFSAVYISDIERNNRHCSPRVREFYESLQDTNRSEGDK